MRLPAWLPPLLAGVLLAPTPGSAAPVELAARFELLHNQAPGGGFRATLTLRNTGREPLPAEGWALYLSFLRSLDAAALPPSVALDDLPGDLYRLEPTAAFEPLAPGESLELPIAGTPWVIKESEAPAGLYLVVDGTTVPVPIDVAPFTTPAQTARTAEDRLPVSTAESRYRDVAALPAPASDPLDRITPTPVETVPGTGSWQLDRAATVYHDAGLAGEARLLVEALATHLGAPLDVVEGAPPAGHPSVRLRLGPVDAAVLAGRHLDQGYRLVVDAEDGVTITAPSAAGVFWGAQTLLALLPLDSWAEPRTSLSLPAVTVVDAPGLAYRGLHLDVARNMQPKAEVLRLLDAMAFYKLDRFHFHLTDDEGWRLEIAGLPELTEVGARRGHTEDERDRLQPAYGSGPDPDAAPGSGHFSRADFVEILRHAQARHIEVVPEIDVPGHARAAIKAMEARTRRGAAAGLPEADAYRLVHPEDSSVYTSIQGYPDNVIDVCLPSTWRFLGHVVDDLVAMYAEAGVPLGLLHVGGDEVPEGAWTGSPACAALIAESPELEDVGDLPAHFFERLRALLAERDLAMAGWEEVALIHDEDGVRPNPELAGQGVVPYVWNNVWGWGREEIGYQLANAGYPVVLANATHLYFDMAYAKDPEEPGYYWAAFGDTRSAFVFLPYDLYRSAEVDLQGNPLDPGRYADATRLTEAGRANVRGIQGQLWGENLGPPDRLAYLAFPKLLGLAERAWNPEPAWAEGDLAGLSDRRDAAWAAFAARLGRWELPRLDHLAGGFAYRLPPPGAVVEDGRLHANVAFPGLEIRYTTDGTLPAASSPRYSEPVAVDGPVTLRSFDTRGRGSRPAVVD